MTLNTANNIAKEMGLPWYTVNYAIKSMGIEPTEREGNIRFFSDQDTAKIKEKLAQRQAG